MSSENIKILGQYRFQEGGSIQLFIGPNMEFGTEHSTQVHEMYHMHLTNITSFGVALGILDMERALAEEIDAKQSSRMKKLIDVMSERMLEVQEIYSNNMELLWIHEHMGSKAEKRSYNSKPKEYQQYCDALKSITGNDAISTLEKQQRVNLVCMYAMNIDLLSEEFLDSLRTDQFARYFSGEHNPSQRLEYGLSLYSREEHEPLFNSFQRDIDKFVEQIQMDGVLKYVNWKEMKKSYDRMLREIGEDQASLERITSLYHNQMEESIQAFDFSAIKVFRGFSFAEHDTHGLFVLKHCANLDNPEENYYLIDHVVHEGNPKYIGEEATELSILKLIPSKLCVAVHLCEYDLDNSRPKYFDSSGKPIMVLIENYRECNHWIKNELQKGEVYVGDLYDETVNNFFTTLFFNRRNDPNTIFVFPTTKRLGMKLIKDNGLSGGVLYSNQEEFLKIFSCLSNEADMLKVMHWLMTFLTNSNGEFTSLEDSATKLHFDFIRTLMNIVFKIKRKDYYKQMAALPTLLTEGEPFYTLMEFEGGYNTGSIKAETEEGYPLFFNLKQDALQWLKFNSGLVNYQVVGVDRRYWNELKPFLLQTQKKVCICISVENRNAIIVDPQYIDRFIIENRD